jgi:hypothetical protein
LVLRKYQSQYQLFILTHDRSFFNITKRKLELEHDTSKWVFFDLFETKDGAFNKPVLRPSLDPLAVAKAHFKENDYAATVNYQRSFIEGWIINFLPELKLKYESKKGRELFTAKMLDQLLFKAESYFDEIGFNKDILSKIRLYKDLLLNPLSHHENGKSDVYKKEVADIFGFINKLLRLSNEPLIRVNKKIKYSITTLEGTLYEFTLKLLNDFRRYKQSENDFSIDSIISVQIISVLKDGIELLGDNTRVLKNKTLKAVYKDGIDGIVNFDHLTPNVRTDYDLVFKNEAGRTLQDLMI